MTKPTKPRSPTATPRKTRVKLRWLAPSSTGGAKISKYAVQRSRTGTSNWKTLGYPKRTAFAAFGLQNGVRYYFRIRARNAAGWSATSKVVSAVPRTVPSAPRSPTATPGDQSVKLTWLAPSTNGAAAIDKYAVQRALSTSGPWKNIAYPTTRSRTAGGLTNGTPYYFRMRAHNAAGWGPSSTVVTAIARTVPGAPPTPVATPGSSTVTLSWSPPTNTGGAKIDTYQVQQQGLFGAWYDLASTSSLGYTATGLYNGSTYVYRVLAHNVAGWGTPSLPVQAVPFTTPGAPMKLAATSGKDWINLTWDPPLGNGGRPVQGYWIYRSTSLNGTYSSLKYTQSLSDLESPLAGGTAYYYKVAACNVAGCGSFSGAVYAIVPTVPAQPPACTATQLYGPGSDWVRVQWTPPANTGGVPLLDYKVHIDYDKVYATAQPVGNATSVDIYMPADSSGQPYNGQYSYNVFVAAHNAAGISAECGANFWMEP